MGAAPAWILLSLSLPRTCSDRWLEGFALGLGRALRTWNVALVGGDTTSSPGPRVVSVSAGGRCVASPMTRAGAEPGDQLFVAGWLGLAGLGWMSAEPPVQSLAALQRPCPPLTFCLALAKSGLATSCMDVSDGLAEDLPRLARASRVGIIVDDVPLHPAIAAHPLARRAALCGGEDYVPLFTARAGDARAVHALAAAHDTPLHTIGTITSDGGVRLASGTPLPSPAFRHFEETP